MEVAHIGGIRLAPRGDCLGCASRPTPPTPSEVDHWRATALAAAGRTVEAGEVAAAVQPRDLGLSCTRRRLRRSACASRSPAARSSRRPSRLPNMLAEAHPLSALELLAALAEARRRAGDTAAADAARRECAGRAEALAATLAAIEPRLAAALAGRWAVSRRRALTRVIASRTPVTSAAAAPAPRTLQRGCNAAAGTLPAWLNTRLQRCP